MTASSASRTAKSSCSGGMQLLAARDPGPAAAVNSSVVRHFEDPRALRWAYSRRVDGLAPAAREGVREARCLLLRLLCDAIN